MSCKSCPSFCGVEMAKTELTRDEVLTQLRKHKPELEKQFGVADLALYGVYAPEDTAEFFDIDLMITFNGPTSSKRFFGVQHYIEDLLGLRVGLVTKRSLSEERRRYFEEIAIDV